MWIAIFLASLLALLVLLLSIPLRISLSIIVDDSVAASWRLTWLFICVTKQIRKRERKPGKARPQRTKEKVRKKKHGKPGDFVRILLNKKLWKQVLLLFKRLFKQIQIKELNVNLKIGLDDPGAWLIAGSAIWTTLFLHPPFQHSINIKPCFTDEFIARGIACGEVRVIPLRLLLPVIGFVFSMPVLRTATRLVAARWKRNR